MTLSLGYHWYLGVEKDEPFPFSAVPEKTPGSLGVYRETVGRRIVINLCHFGALWLGR